MFDSRVRCSLNLALATSAFVGVSSLAAAQPPDSVEREPVTQHGNRASATASRSGDSPLATAEQAHATVPRGAPVTGQSTVYYVENATPSSEAVHARPDALAPSSGSTPSSAAPASALTAPLAPQLNGASNPALTPVAKNAAADAAEDASADYSERRRQGFELYAGVGGAFAMGSFDAAGELPISDAAAGAVTGMLGVGYRFSPHFYAGGYVEGGVGPVNKDETFAFCEDNSELECSSGVVRYGLEGRYTVNPADKVAFWMGLGLGGDALNAKAKVKDGETVAVISANGTEVLVKGGVNFPVSKQVTADLFIGYARGSLSAVEVRVLDESAEVADPGSNGWLSMGLAFVL